jgi:hypothetical protein
MEQCPPVNRTRACWLPTGHGMNKPLSSASTCLHSGIPFLLYSFCSGGQRPLSSSVVESNTACRAPFFFRKDQAAGAQHCLQEPNTFTGRIPHPPNTAGWSPTPPVGSHTPQNAAGQSPTLPAGSRARPPGARRLVVAPGHRGLLVLTGWIPTSPAGARPRSQELDAWLQLQVAGFARPRRQEVSVTGSSPPLSPGA